MTTLFCDTDTEPKIQKKWFTVRWDPVKQTRKQGMQWQDEVQELKLADYERIWCRQLTFQRGGGACAHNHPSQLTSCINKGSFSSCTSVPSSTFTTTASFPSQRDVWHVSLHESGTSFGKCMQFCKTTKLLSLIILICHYTLSTQLFCSILYSSSSLQLLEVY